MTQIIQSVTSAMAYYATQTTKLPTALIEELEKLNRKPFWGEIELQRNMHTITLETIYKPEDKGGVDLKNVGHMNVALLAKLCWRMLGQSGSTLG